MSSPNENYFQFEELLVKLANSGVDFAMVGGVAVSRNGFVWEMDDVDILVGKSSDNLRKLLDCLAEGGQGFARELKVEDFADAPGAIRIMENFELDIFLQMRGKSLDGFRPNLRFIESGAARIACLSPADLIFLKDGSWGEEDQLDVSAMKEIIAREAKQE